MKKLFTVLAFCGLLLIPRTAYAYETDMASSGGATDISYTPSDIVITAPVEPLNVPQTGDMNHEFIGDLFILSGAFLVILFILHKKQEKEEEYQ